MAFSIFTAFSTNVYDALPDSKHIRFIKLAPALRSTDPLHVTFLSAPYYKLAGQYEALSYTWGDPKLAFPVFLSNGCHVLVTKNLNRALRRVRLEYAERLLWVDGICINQSDAKEKAIQIPLMVNIFRGAEKVLAWLGDGDQYNVEKVMQQLGYNFQHRARALRKTIPQDHLLELLHLSWFNRRWIVQEVVFNNNVALMYGEETLDWEAVAEELRDLNKNVQEEVRNDQSLEMTKIHAVRTITKLWKGNQLRDTGHADLPSQTPTTQKADQVSILQLMHDLADYECTDQRDRIYALYSMTRLIQPTSLAATLKIDGIVFFDIDYSLDVPQTHEKFTNACLEAGYAQQTIEEALERPSKAYSIDTRRHQMRLPSTPSGADRG